MNNKLRIYQIKYKARHLDLEGLAVSINNGSFEGIVHIYKTFPQTKEGAVELIKYCLKSNYKEYKRALKLISNSLLSDGEIIVDNKKYSGKELNKIIGDK